MDGFMTLFVLAVIIAGLVFAAKIIFIVFVVKKGVDLFQQHQAAFESALAEQQRLLGAARTSGGHASPDQQAAFQAAFFKAQRELGQLDALRRQQSELRLADMSSQAASMGIYIDPSSM